MASLYQTMIVRASGCPLSRADEIEDMMRTQYGTLDHLDRQTFAREARLCWSAAQLRDEHVALGPSACVAEDAGIGYCPICGREMLETMKPFKLLGRKGGAR